MSPLPCPPWCVADHAQELARSLELAQAEGFDPFEGAREHRSAEARVSVMAYGGGDSDRTVSVSVTATDDLADGTRTEVGVWLEAGGEVLSPGQAIEYAAAILKAANTASGGALDRMLLEGKSMRPWHHWSPRGGVA